MPKKAQRYITKEGLEKLKKELEILKTVKKAEVAARLKEALSYGDLKENSEYESARAEQALMESRIREIEDEIAQAEVVSKKTKKSSIIELGSKVTASDSEGDKISFLIVGSTEIDIINHHISNESPVGQAIMGGTVGDKFSVKTPKGIIEYKILNVE